MKKIQTHCHLLGSSRCANANTDELIADLITAGYDGGVITNHYCARYFDGYNGQTKSEKLDYYFSILDDAEPKFEKAGLKFFYGAEVQIKLLGGMFAEYILYGFDRRFLYDNKPLFDYDQKELFELCEENGVFMYQAHPFRNGVTLGDPKYMHGAEYFNGHVGHHNHNNFARDFCDKYGLIKMSGSDYHDKGQPLLGGIYVPDDIDGNFSLTECIKNNEHIVIDERKKYMALTGKKEQLE